MRKEKKSLKALIVDDDDCVRNVIKNILELKNFAVEEAKNGKEALEKVFKDKPDIILLDCNMPVMGGFETYRKLKENRETQNIPIIFCAAGDITEISKRKIEVNDYIRKPFSVDELLTKIYKNLKFRSPLARE